MTQPITVDIPHQLGKAAARTRMENGVGKLAGMIPGGAEVEHRWDGDTLHFTVAAMGQRIASTCEVMDDKVRATIDLPPLLSLFADRIRTELRENGGRLLA